MREIELGGISVMFATFVEVEEEDRWHVAHVTSFDTRMSQEEIMGKKLYVGNGKLTWHAKI